MNIEELLKERAEIQYVLRSLKNISIYDDDGEIDDDAYQDKLEQQEYKRELYEELDIINSQLNKFK